MEGKLHFTFSAFLLETFSLAFDHILSQSEINQDHVCVCVCVCIYIYTYIQVHLNKLECHGKVHLFQ